PASSWATAPVLPSAAMLVPWSVVYQPAACTGGSGSHLLSAVLSSVCACVAATVSKEHHHARAQLYADLVLARIGLVLQLGWAALQAGGPSPGTRSVCGRVGPGTQWRTLFGLLRNLKGHEAADFFQDTAFWERPGSSV